MLGNVNVTDGRRVLLVEDDGDVAEVTSEFLGDIGCDVEVARTGAEALAAAIRLLPDVILMDLSLPDLDGTAVARRIRAACGPSVRLVALSGHARSRRPEEAGDLSPFDDYLLKPVDLATLESAVAVKQMS